MDDKQHAFEFNEKNIDSTDLMKQRGLCLVPLSLFYRD
jgi:hypothetical protein